ncbi:Aspartate/alanine antiporter [Fundidesulfovibrio magnetotacticus]|uniref:Aspartate/alanine antiporter n=1 Tax=Fundidesulfovibrio magnetotacticus TaxID=2730080 RepID=A0A6V8LR86_9BACT|nr:putative transporter [Fundidesulfovibrio magnetotacticus]GFK92848.1 Aspartate/alanine antiporter [Fundidesulfovibrio magnetotacticus]
MNWFAQLFTNHTPAQAVVVLSLAVVLGLALGRVRVMGISLGVGGVLFSALALGHLGFSLNHEVMEFAREFGLILFVYTIGMQVGPGFADSLRRRGFRLNAMAALIVALGVAITALLHVYGGLPVPVAVGLFSGGTTNTPSLAAAAQAFQEVMPQGAAQAVGEAGLGYAVAYPFGIFGIILVMLLIRLIFRIDPARELRQMEEMARAQSPPLETVTLEVANPGLEGLTLGQAPGLTETGAAVSRVMLAGQVSVAVPSTVLRQGMLLHAVGRPDVLEKLAVLVGRVSRTHLPAVPGPLEMRRFVITRSQVVGKSVAELKLAETFEVNPTRLGRAGMQFTPGPDVHLHLGDVLQVVGQPERLAQVERLLGNQAKDLDHPHVLPIFLGILLGTVAGAIPVALPGLPSGIKLGVAGGPLLVSILLSRLHHFGGLVWYMHPGANLILREVGISLFLGCVGLGAGGRFVAAIAGGEGLYWLAAGAAITFVPLFVAGLIGRVFLKCNYASMCGLLAGSMTDPPALAFAGQMLKSDAPASVYATVYPLVMILRILAGQLLVLLMASG